MSRIDSGATVATRTKLVGIADGSDHANQAASNPNGVVSGPDARRYRLGQADRTRMQQRLVHELRWLWLGPHRQDVNLPPIAKRGARCLSAKLDSHPFR